MIKNILQMLTIDDFNGESEFIDIAKGRNEIPKTFNKAYKQIKRKHAWKKRP
jgi:hypothetical protein